MEPQAPILRITSRVGLTGELKETATGSVTFDEDVETEEGGDET